MTEDSDATRSTLERFDTLLEQSPVPTGQMDSQAESLGLAWYVEASDGIEFGDILATGGLAITLNYATSNGRPRRSTALRHG